MIRAHVRSLWKRARSEGVYFNLRAGFGRKVLIDARVLADLLEPVDDIDPRLGYVYLQPDRRTYLAARRCLP